MKRLFSFFFLFCAMALIPFSAWGADKKDIVDFNYPQDVSKAALSDLNTALKTNNGELVVDALVRYSIAQSGISQDNMKPIVERIESTIASEKQPHVKALLSYFEASLFQAYRNRYRSWDRENPEGELPEDYSEWDAQQFSTKIDQLLAQTLADRDALRAVKVTDMPHIIMCSEQGALMVPTLHEFLSMKALELANNEAFIKEVERQWVQRCSNDTPAYIFAMMATGKSKDDLYEQFAQNEHAGIVLSEMGAYKSNYQMFKDYVGRFPNAPYTPTILNKIYDIEEKNVSLSYNEHAASTDSIKVTATVTNVNTFVINVYRLPEALVNNAKRRNYKLTELERVGQHTVNVQGNVPFTQYDVETMLPPLAHGIYVITPSFNSKDGKKETATGSYYDELQVSDLAMFLVEHDDDATDRVMVVDVKTGKPVKGATVTNLRSGSKRTTDVQGMVTIPSTVEYAEFKATNGTDTYGSVINYNRGSYYNNASRVIVNLYTDLNIYRPGEQVKWAAVVYRFNDLTKILWKNEKPQIRSLLRKQNLRVIFRDSNREAIDTVEVVTDDYGRIEGTFTVPTDRMNGKFSIDVYDVSPQKYLGGDDVNVSEYKTPTFTVTFPDMQRSYVKGKDIQITGLVETYSGVPVAGADVKLQLRQQSWSWWWWVRTQNKQGALLVDSIVHTDAQGRFTLNVEAGAFTENEENYSYAHYYYTVDAECTNPAGETQSGSASFIIGKRRGLSLPEDLTYVNTKPLTLPLTFNSTDENEKTVQCIYEVTDKRTKQVVLTGNFRNDKPVVDFTKLPSGEYKVKVSILDDKDNTGTEATMDLILYRTTDTTLPISDSPLWVPQEGRSVDNNNVAHITIGTSTPNAYIYYVASTTTATVAEGWLRYKPGIHTLDLPIPREEEEYLNVRLITMKDGTFHREHFRINAPANEEALHIRINSFRDKLVPGEHEKWSFSLVGNDSTARRGAMMLAMTDKALNSLSDNTWRFGFPVLNGDPISLNAQSLQGSNSTKAYWQAPSLKEMTYTLPYLYTYDQTPFSWDLSFGDRKLRARGANMDMLGAAAGAKMVREEEVYYSMDKQNVTEEAADVDETCTPESLDNVQVREADVKTALWMPSLVTDANGNLTVEFEAPNFNTTWMVQALAWDRGVHTDVAQREVLTQKPIMVRANMPRFVRNGDVVTLAASVMNATEQASAYDAVIELFNPRTDELIDKRVFKGNLPAKGTEAVTIDWAVPADIPFVGFRIKAANDVYGDGEQVMVPVLPSTQPVIETQPFYIDPGTSHFEASLPAFPADARVTLEYCDNPTWYCVTALPTIFDDNLDVSTALVHSLFALDVAHGVAQSNPRILEAINHWLANSQDSTLVSMLARNQDLKIGTLLASPWLREADRQTLRMSRLGELFDEQISSKQRNTIIQKLQSLQMHDGGWTWFRYPGCMSSLYTTSEVLEVLGEIRQLGYAPADERITQMVENALPYFDTEYLRIYNERKDKKDYSGFSSYVYVRSLWPEVKMTRESKRLFDNALKHMNKNWNKGLSLGEKAFYAMTLNRNGYTKTAKNIIESIRQFSITKPNLGMYWDNLQVGWRYFDKVAITSTILQAMNECDPRQDEIDAVRKWMLLMKQSNDWGSRSLAADAVCSLLTTGSQWLGEKSKPTITVAGEPIEIDELDGFLGYFRKTIPASASGSVVIDHDPNSPSWGAIYTQYVGKMSQLQAASIEDLSIEKQYCIYGKDNKLEPATEFHVGDKVQVRLVIKNAKDLDFVTVADERASCFEPVDQLSGYRHGDRSWYYLETKDSRTNIFFSDLQKGTHVITYDVHVMASGQFSAGIATAQCQYAPQITAHSAGTALRCQPK